MTLARNWWSLIIRGLVAILLGVITFAWPGITLNALVLLFAAYALIDGVMSIVGAWRASQAQERWEALLLAGLAGIAAAIVTIFWPAITAIAFVYVIAAWAVVTGIFELVAAVRLRKQVSGEWLLALGGAASVLFGILLIMAPITGALVIALWIGAFAFVFGILLIALGFRLRSWTKTLAARHSATA